MSSPKRIRESENPSGWQDIPPDLFAAVAKRCTSITDYFSIRRVCRCWRSAATFQNFDKKSTRIPLLMHFPQEEEKETKKKEETEPVTNPTRVANFYDLSVMKSHKIPNFPPVNQLKYLSWSGWILCVSNDAYLTHPMWRIRIYLPDLGTFPPCTEENGSNSALSISKMVLSDSPTMKSDLLVMVIWGDKNQLAFCRIGDNSWTVMDSWEVSFSDIIYHNNRLYAVDCNHTLVQCDVHGQYPAQIHKVFTMPAELIHGNINPEKRTCYLVESSGKILIVYRYIHNDKGTLLFQVFEFDLMDRTCKRILDLGKRALFLGSNSSLAIDLSDTFLSRGLSVWRGVMSNRIYFTDHCVKSMGSDTGVFCLSGSLIKRYFCGFFARASSAPPTWVLPSF